MPLLYGDELADDATQTFATLGFTTAKKLGERSTLARQITMGKSCITSYKFARYCKTLAVQKSGKTVNASVIAIGVHELQAGIEKAEYWRGAAARAASFIALWLALAGAAISDLPAMIAAIVAATFVSVRLLPPGGVHPSLAGLGALAADFLRQSAFAGADVAWRALSPRMPLKPGYVTTEVQLPPGPARSAFCTLMSLLPGSLPAWHDGEGKVVIHCLDDGQPIAGQMAEEEKLFVRAFGVKSGDD